MKENWVRRDKGLKRNIEYILSFSVARRNYSVKYFYLKKLNKTKRSYLFLYLSIKVIAKAILIEVGAVPNGETDIVHINLR
jgi:hypothetical protein